MSAQVAADLRAAADVLERDGWAQGAYHRGSCHCAEGAIALVIGQHVQVPADDEEWWEDHPDAGSLGGGWAWLDSEELWDKRRILEWTVEQRLAGTSIPDWNDAPGRTAAEVIAALRAAADAAEAQP